MNTMKERLQALGLLDRALAATTDDEIEALLAALDDDHREAVERLADGITPAAIREAAAKGRVNGTLEGIAVVLADACLADCIEQLGDHADNPTSDQLREVLPGLVERHGLACTRLMLATTVVGEAPASAIVRDLLKHDDDVKLPPMEPRPIAPVIEPQRGSDAEREAVKAKRREVKLRRQAEARARREQSARARHHH
ncbi:MAG TPA: hypothetical protein VNO51_01485 [Ilumatobacteraceae bacterium]|nr:hypothetical protein [Ilumatobacteraceae bacterium]